MKKKENLSIEKLLEIIEDNVDEPRRSGGHMRHKLVDILVIILLGVVCGCKEWIEIEDFSHEKEEWLREFLELPNGIPSDDTYRRVMECVNPKQLEKAYRKWVLPYVGTCLGKQIAIDGKTVRGASSEENKLHIISAWVREDGISLGQLRTNEKSNEITAIPQLLDSMDIYGAVVTIDAMGCQTKIAEDIIEKQANYVLAVKQNQPTLYEDIEEYFNWATNDSIEQKNILRYSECDGEHGRITRRTVEVSHDVRWYEAKKEWQQLNAMIRVTHRTEHGDSISIEKRYYISSAPWDAKRFAEIIRGHWSIENNLHWQLDVCFGEDISPIHKDHSPENLNIVRKIAKAMLQQESSFKASINRKQRRALMSHDYFLAVILATDFSTF